MHTDLNETLGHLCVALTNLVLVEALAAAFKVPVHARVNFQ